MNAMTEFEDQIFTERTLELLRQGFSVEQIEYFTMLWDAGRSKLEPLSSDEEEGTDPFEDIDWDKLSEQLVIEEEEEPPLDNNPKQA